MWGGFESRPRRKAVHVLGHGVSRLLWAFPLWDFSSVHLQVFVVTAIPIKLVVQSVSLPQHATNELRRMPCVRPLVVQMRNDDRKRASGGNSNCLGLLFPAFLLPSRASPARCFGRRLQSQCKDGLAPQCYRDEDELRANSKPTQIRTDDVRGKVVLMLFGWDVVVLTIPLIAIFAIWMFGLDDRLVNQKLQPKRRQRFCETEQLLFTDPDGKPLQLRPAEDCHITGTTQTTIDGVRETNSPQL